VRGSRARLESKDAACNDWCVRPQSALAIVSPRYIGP
jgi:hypothetical protein